MIDTPACDSNASPFVRQSRSSATPAEPATIVPRAEERPVVSSEELSQLRRLALASALEAVTLLALLGIAVPLKYLAGWETGVRLLGPAHGFAFLLYIWSVLQSMGLVGWRRGELAGLVLAAFLPAGGFFTLRLLNRRIKRLRANMAAR